MSAKRTERRSRQHRPYHIYAFTLEKWDWSYSFSPPVEKVPAYRDQQFLRVSGTLFYPRRSKGKRVELLLIPRKERALGPNDYLVDFVGHMHWSRSSNAFTCTANIVEDVLPCVIPLLVANRLRYVLLTSNSPFRGGLDIAQYDFADEILEVDYPDIHAASSAGP